MLTAQYGDRSSYKALSQTPSLESLDQTEACQSTRPFPDKDILFVDGDTVVNYDTGLSLPLKASLPHLLLTGRGGFICGKSLYSPLAELDQELKKEPIEWRMKIVNQRRKAITRDGQIAVLGVFQVSYLSYRNPGGRSVGSRNGSRRSNWIRWDILNLESFSAKAIEFTLKEIMEGSIALLTLCESRGVTFRNSRGGLASQLLRASPFWNGKERRPAPKFINDFSRKQLPGNHYSVSDKVTATSMEHCYYIDQNNSHHQIASEVHIPHPNWIRARGFFNQGVLGQNHRYWTKSIPTGHNGLFLCRIQINTIPLRLKHLYPKWVTDRKPGEHMIWLWSPEFRLLENDHLVSLVYVACGFSSTRHDMAITEYADFATTALTNKTDKPYIKQVLLAAYGVLAFNPSHYKSYRYWTGTVESKGSEVKIPIIGEAKEVCIKLPDTVQIKATNVIARGIIEAETRTRSILLARELTAQGFHIPQIYADGLLVESDRLPILPPNWRVSHSLTHVRIPRKNAIVSDQLVKMPGMTQQEKAMRYTAWQPVGGPPTEQVFDC